MENHEPNSPKVGVTRFSERPRQYQGLEDVFGAGDLEVWYMRPEFFRFGTQGARPNHDPNNLLWTHIKLGSVSDCKVGDYGKATLDQMWMELQGERWSPNGEARELIRSMGLKHTSMSVGDCFRLPTGEVWIAADEGFKRVDEPA